MAEQMSMHIVAGPEPPSRRTDAGKLRASVKKAIGWYVVEHALTLTAASAYPVFWFKDRVGQDVKVNVEDIISEYDQWRRINKSKRKVAS